MHLLVLYSPMNHVFHSVPLGLADWGIILGASAVLIFVDMVFKAIAKQRQAEVRNV